MKKIVCLLLIAVLAFSGVIAAAEEGAAGTWYMTAMTFEGITVDPASIGMEMTLVLNEDGTAGFNAMGESMEGTWAGGTDTVTVTLQGTDLMLTFDGSSLSGELEGAAVKFEREASSGFERPNEVYVENISDFDGNWVPVQFGIGGIYMDAAVLSSFGLDSDTLSALSFIIENGSVKTNNDTQLFSLVDGLLFYEDPEQSDEESAVRIELLEGDLIEVNASYLPVSIICARAEAAQQAA